jgi:hypothetical protein
MANYVYIIVLLEAWIFGVVFTIIWLPECFSHSKHHVFDRIEKKLYVLEKIGYSDL